MTSLSDGVGSIGHRLPVVRALTPAPNPLSAVEQLRGLPYLLFLDSAADPARLGRYSFLMADPDLVIIGHEGETIVTPPDGRGVTRTADDPLLVVRGLLASHPPPATPGLPPFIGGAAGYIGYDYGARLERLPRPRYDDLRIPDVLIGVYDWVIAWDHQLSQAWLISTGLPEREPQAQQARAERRATAVMSLLEGGVAPHTSPRTTSFGERDAAEVRAPTAPVEGHPALRSSFSHAAYLEAVGRVREYVHAGDIFQANLSQRFEAVFERDPWALYRTLRQLNRAPFAAYFETPELVVVSASPERFIRVDPDGCVETRPIKGTRPRGIGPEHDAHLGRALSESEKDRAENLMIVDLLRNDLSRVCRPGSVRVPELFALEHYSTVHHLVSTVVGQLAPEADAVDLLRAAFPGGSITGAPKIRAMEIIAELEPSRRGVYCGSMVYLSPTGAADSSIIIRTFLVRHGRVYFSGGGGIVADSEPEAEYQETLDKVRSLIAAVELNGAGG
jgi:para-aminobenzoate synthetase component 1